MARAARRGTATQGRGPSPPPGIFPNWPGGDVGSWEEDFQSHRAGPGNAILRVAQMLPLALPVIELSRRQQLSLVANIYSKCV